jgi:methionine aminopeptidase
MVKTPDELALMRLSGKLLASVFEMLDRQDLVGMSTLAVDDLVDRFISVDLAARPASKGQYGYRHALNCSVNHVVCHGIPGSDVILRDGDIVNFDVTLEKNGFIADSSKTYLVGNASPGGEKACASRRGSHVARHSPGSPGGACRRYRLCHRAPRQKARLLHRSRILRARHRAFHA